MPQYQVRVEELLNLDTDGNVTARRLVTFRNPTDDEIPILVEELQEFFPDSASDFAVFDETLNSPITNLVVEDHYYSQQVTWTPTIVTLAGKGEHTFRVDYRRSFVAHYDRGYLHLTVGYASHRVTNFSLVVVAPSHIERIHVKKLQPQLEGDAAEYVFDDDREVRFSAREVSMNRRFRLELALDVLGDIDVPALPVVSFVTRQLKSKEWFPTGWEA